MSTLAPEPKSSRIASLDSLRGLAALSVMLWHVLGIFPIASSPWLRLTPLHMLEDGKAAVMIFFALSGFVLMLPYLGTAAVDYRTFLIKRFFRIYPACWAVLTLSLIGYGIIGRHIPSTVDAIKLPLWYAPPNLIAIGLQSLLIGGPVQLIPVLWTLFLEVRISLIFPNIAALIRKHPWQTIMVYTLPAYIAAAFLNATNPAELCAVFAQTIECASLFVCGAILAKYRFSLQRWFTGLKGPSKFFVVMFALILYCAGLPLRNSDFGNMMASAFSVLVLCIVVMSTEIDRILSHPNLIWLGSISYSLYLVHFVVLGSMVFVLNGLVPLWVSVLPVIPCSILAAAFLQRFVEAPFIRFARLRFHSQSPNVMRLNEPARAGTI